ncbi:hypothetical protein [Exiguobacterium artemiae]|uniref:hypothetical protein n=1 Tax=Exiguobacterium artemiae TaxID=340145 RepID=UPI00047CC538|nr:hypothetical protein [Exiguobacterium sibiricum]
MSVFTDYEEWLDEVTDEMIEHEVHYAVAELKLGGEIGDYYEESGLIDRFVTQQMVWLSFEEMEQILDEAGELNLEIVADEAESDVQRSQVKQILKQSIKQQLVLKSQPFVATRLEQLRQEHPSVKDQFEEVRSAYDHLLRSGPEPTIIPKRWYRRGRVVPRTFTPAEQTSLEQEHLELTPQYETQKQKLEELSHEIAAYERVLP